MLQKFPFGVDFNDKQETIDFAISLGGKHIVWERQGILPPGHSRYFIAFLSRMGEQYGKPVKAVFISNVGMI